MLTDLRSHFKDFTPKIIPQWSQYLYSLRLQKRQLSTRFLNQYGYEPRGFRILKQILDSLDVEHLVKQPNDFARYFNGLLPARLNANRLLQPVEYGRAYRKVFYKKGLFATNEYLCPVDDVDHIKILPFDRPWEEWEKVKPVHLWYHDSNEYSLNLLTGSVVFKYQNPTYAIVFVDVISLLFKYYKYLITPMVGEEKTLHSFIHKHVYNSFFDDLQNTWILNQILICSNIVDSKSEMDVITTDLQPSDRQFGYIGGRYTEAMEHLTKAFMDVRLGKIRVNSLLCSELLPSGSIIDRIEYSLKYLDVAHRNQLRYIRILRDMPIIDLIIQMYSWRSDVELYKSLRRELRYIVRRYINSKPWSKIYDSAIRTHIKDWLIELDNRLAE